MHQLAGCRTRLLQANQLLCNICKQQHNDVYSSSCSILEYQESHRVAAASASILRRSRSLQHMHALNSRCRELQGQLKQCKQELRRARKTVKTLELVATAVSSGAATAAAPPAAAAAAAASSAVNMTVQGSAQQQQQQQAVPVVLPNSQHVLTVQQQGSGLMYMTAGVSNRIKC